ncbi:MAG: patatin-like phospholipase family protein [Bacillota bacterium]
MAYEFGLALGAGGLRGAAHIGVLQVLEEAGLKPDVLSGTSSGAAVAVAYAAGKSPGELERIATGLGPSDLVDATIGPWSLMLMALDLVLRRLGLPSPLPAPPLGLIRGDRLERLVEEWTKSAAFAELGLPVVVVATDIDCACRVVFGHPHILGRLEGLRRLIVDGGVGVARAVRASSSIPGIFVPTRTGRRTLVDGALMDSVPAQLLKEAGCRKVVAVRLGFVDRRREQVRDILEVLNHSIDIMGDEATACELDHFADIVVDPEIYDVGLREVHRIEEIIERGRQAARRALPSIRRALNDG